MRYALLALLFGCASPKPDAEDSGDVVAVIDADGDGSAEGADCDDAAAAVYPGAPEVAADGVDQDCDGMDLCYVDADGDGYGQDATETAPACDGAGVADNAEDCNDTDTDFHPGAEEPCEEDIDYNCDGATEFDDGDGDGWAACGEGGAGDCDDAAAASYPGAPEVPADGIDQDCDGNDACYYDEDGDAFGGPGVLAGEGLACDGEGQATNADDCDDEDEDVHPGADEVVGDEIDQSCDGAEACWADADGDGVGSAASVESADADCEDAGESTSAADCAAADASIYPGAPEAAADGIDQDCDGNDTCHLDADEDGFGGSGTKVGSGLNCDVPGSNLADDSGDCDDAAAASYPGAPEVTGDEIDQSCDGAEVCWTDADGDRYGVASEVASVDVDCDDAGESAFASDCAAADASIYPGAPEVTADGIDQSCDGNDVCYYDGDEDGFGGASARVGAGLSCDVPGSNLADDADDCDDAAADAYPGAPEVTGDEIDQSCDGAEDCYLDDDGDGYGAGELVASADIDCDDAGESTSAADCVADDPAYSPSAAEVALDGIDQDCDGYDACYLDLDRDGFGGEGTITSGGGSCDDAAANRSENAEDCDDSDPASYPDAPEIAGDELDQSCDGAEICYLDADGDGYGAAEVASDDEDCGDAGESSSDEDCLDEGDGAADTWPGAAAKEAGGECMTDADGDGYGSDAPADGVTAGRDCDDADSAVTCVSASLHVGNDTEFSSASSHGANYLLGSELVVAAPMTVTHLALIAKSSVSNVKMALYTDSGGNPGSLVVSTSGTPVTAGVMEIAVAPTAIAAGTYWIMGIFDTSASIGIDSTDPAAVVKYRSLSYSAALPDPFGAVTTYTGQKFNYYLVGY